jgi:hypothetical protein
MLLLWNVHFEKPIDFLMNNTNPPYGKFLFLLDQKTELSNYNNDEIKL